MMLHSLLYWTAMAFCIPVALCLGALVGTAAIRLGIAAVEAVEDRL